MYTSEFLALLSAFLVAAALFVNESAAFFLTNETLADETPHISHGCYRCLCHVNTYCTISDECKDSHCGPFNISKVYWEEAGQVTLPDDDPERNDAWKDCAKNYFCAQKIIEGYVKKFAKDCNGDGVINCFDYMMINYNGGSDCSPPLNSTTIGRIWVARYEECRTVRLLS